MMVNVEKGSGSVFADLGIADAEALEAKVRLATAINGWRRRHDLSAVALGMVLHTWEGRVEDIAAYRLNEIPLHDLIWLACGLLDGSVSAFIEPADTGTSPPDEGDG